MLIRGLKFSFDGKMFKVSSGPMFNAADAKITYGDKLVALLNRHKVVHKEVETRDEKGRFLSFHYEVGGYGPKL